jgi:hypothetical protein
MLGKSKASKSAKELFAKSKGINLLAAARVFLFGARDVWFVVGVPVYLYAAGWTFSMVGGFLAVWTIGYGLVQAIAPQLVKRSEDGLTEEVPAARLWSFMLAVVPIALAWYTWQDPSQSAWVVVIGLGIFGVAFAVNSSVHSYLILAYAGSAKAAEDVGFYYAANASGRGWADLGAVGLGHHADPVLVAHASAAKGSQLGVVVINSTSPNQNTKTPIHQRVRQAAVQKPPASSRLAATMAHMTRPYEPLIAHNQAAAKGAAARATVAARVMMPLSAP